MITREVRNFSLRQIAESGQCFRMTRLPWADVRELLREEDAGPEWLQADCPAERAEGPCAYLVRSGGQAVIVCQKGELAGFLCGDAEFARWEEYFDLGTDYGAYIASVDKEDPYLRRAAEAGSGIRILRQDVWEMVITFVISQQKTIPAIRALVETVSRRYGTRKETGYGLKGADAFYTFPTPGQLAGASPEELRELKLGYRANYIAGICSDVRSGALDLAALGTMRCGDALEYLKGCCGIGDKVASCICLFGLHHVEAFPIDTWIRQILMREYAPRCGGELAKLPASRQCGYLADRFFGRYRGYAGVMQQYMFYYERHIHGADAEK